MSKKFISISASMFLAGISFLNATNESQDGFAVLAEKSGLNIEEPSRKSSAKNDIVLSQDDNERGFIATVADTAEKITNERRFEPFLRNKIKLFGTRGEYRDFLIAVRALKDLNELNFKLSSLIGGNDTIPLSNINIRRYVTYKEQKGNGHFLEKDFPFALNAGNTAWIWGTVFIPEKASPGNYKGTIVISNGSGSDVSFSLNLLVLDFQLSEAHGNWGVYMPGHFADDKSGNKRWCSNSLKKENLDIYFKFWKSIRFNSPFLYHVYPELKLVNGKVIASFSDISAFAESVKKNSLDGFMLIDTRFIQWWANTASVKYEKMKSEGKDVSGDIGVSCGIPAKKEYSPLAVEFFAEVIKQLFQTAEKEKWPEVLLLPEEEIGNGGTVKPLGYETFTPVLKKISPEKIIVVDNDIGYGRKNAIDRGARDNIKYRQYNSWEEDSLKKAESDGAEIWGYNYGFSRATYGFLQQRLGSTGYHQWADQWINYVYSIITHNGVISSIELEQSRDGRFDYDYCHTLKLYAEKLKKAGFPEEAKKMHERLALILNEIPISGPEFGQWRSKKTSRDLDNMRWMIVAEIQNARRMLKENVMNFSPSTGNPYFSGIVSLSSSPDNASQRKILQVPYLESPVLVDALLNEACWSAEGNSTGPLSWTKSKEIAMRAYASSEEEFRKMPAPSYSRAAFAYDKNGIYIGFRVNHVSPENDKFSTRGDDDAELWRDNCMEFFFKPSREYIYHLIVNTHGKKVFMLGSKAINSSEIKIAVKGNVDSSGGSNQEIFIPWKLFGINGAPIPGSTWLANVGREYHPVRQFTTWSKVHESFWETENWGLLNFTVSSGIAEIKPDSLCLFPGKSRMDGHIVSRDSSELPRGEIFLSIKNASGETVSSAILKNDNKAKKLEFSMEYLIPNLNAQEEWDIELTDISGKELGFLKLPVSLFKSAIVINAVPDFIASGDSFSVEAMLCVGNLDISESLLKGEFVSLDKGTRIPLREIVPTANGECLIWIDASGVSPGKYLFRMWLSRKSGDDAVFEKELEVLPGY